MSGGCGPPERGHRWDGHLHTGRRVQVTGAGAGEAADAGEGRRAAPRAPKKGRPGAHAAIPARTPLPGAGEGPGPGTRAGGHRARPVGRGRLSN